MKKNLPLLVLILGLAAIAATLVPARNQTDFDLVGFGRLPVLVNGRIKPFDTVARTSLLVLQGRQRVTLPNGTVISPVEWLLDVTTRPEIADAYQTIEIVHPDLLTLFGVAPASPPPASRGHRACGSRAGRRSPTSIPRRSSSAGAPSRSASCSSGSTATPSAASPPA
jgi:hypothetical protein